LGVSEEDPFDLINAHYKLLSLKWHSDKNRDGGREVFVMIKESFEKIKKEDEIKDEPNSRQFAQELVSILQEELVLNNLSEEELKDFNRTIFQDMEVDFFDENGCLLSLEKLVDIFYLPEEKTTVIQFLQNRITGLKKQNKELDRVKIEIEEYEKERTALEQEVERLEELKEGLKKIVYELDSSELFGNKEFEEYNRICDSLDKIEKEEKIAKVTEKIGKASSKQTKLITEEGKRQEHNLQTAFQNSLVSKGEEIINKRLEEVEKDQAKNYFAFSENARLVKDKITFLTEEIETLLKPKKKTNAGEEIEEEQLSPAEIEYNQSER
ncbi:17850_t:CDS:2, partial [Funneliformis geosporum]